MEPLAQPILQRRRIHKFTAATLPDGGFTREISRAYEADAPAYSGAEPKDPGGTAQSKQCSSSGHHSIGICVISRHGCGMGRNYCHTGLGNMVVGREKEETRKKELEAI